MPAEPQDSQYKEIDQTVVLAGTFFAYLIMARIGLNIHAVNTFASLIWAPAGIALAAFLMFGRRVWPAIMFAAFLVNSSLGASPLVAFSIALGNTFGPALGALFIRWQSDYKPSVLRLRDNVGIVASALLIPVLTATIGVGCLVLGGEIPYEQFAPTWGTWWIGDALGILIVTPFILKWFHQSFIEKELAARVELFLAVAAVGILSFLIFCTPAQTFFPFYLVIPLTWVALRTGSRGITLSLLLVAGIAIAGTLLGFGPFSTQPLWHLQTFLSTVSGVFLIFTAVVEERRKTLEKLEQHVHELEIALDRISSEDEAKKEFLAILAHELRNPLATVLSSIELLKLQGIRAENSSMLFETIDDRARAMVHLLDDLLDITRIAQKKLELKKEPVAMNRFIEKLVAGTTPYAKKSGHALSVSQAPQELFVDADPSRLEQIFMNLLINAIKYTLPPGKIQIKVSRAGSMATIHIRDSGVGIPKNMLQRIFEPFFQVNRKEFARPKQGLGMGLPITRQLVEMHGGTIEAQSLGAGAGSEFVVRLPLSAKQPSSLSLPSVIANHSPSRSRAVRKVKHTYKILVVDDNEDATKPLAQMLQLRGHEVAVAYTGAEALTKALRFEPEVVILDIGLPDMDGYQVARHLQQQKTPYYLIALTGYGQDEDKERAAQAGFHFHLTKPAGFKEIEAVLRKMPRDLRPMVA